MHQIYFINIDVFIGQYYSYHFLEYYAILGIFNT